MDRQASHHAPRFDPLQFERDGTRIVGIGQELRGEIRALKRLTIRGGMVIFLLELAVIVIALIQRP